MIEKMCIATSTDNKAVMWQIGGESYSVEFPRSPGGWGGFVDVLRKWASNDEMSFTGRDKIEVMARYLYLEMADDE